MSTDLPTIKPGSNGWDEWEQYFFFHLEWGPLILQEVRKGDRECMTVPAEYPWMFDPSFQYDSAKPKWSPPKPRVKTPYPISAMLAKHGPNYGIVNPDTRVWHMSKHEARDKIIAEFGKKAFDDVPDSAIPVPRPEGGIASNPLGQRGGIVDRLENEAANEPDAWRQLNPKLP